MGLTSAMYTGISGLSADSTAINVIGNNIANVNTVGYKGARTMFSDMLYQSIGNNSQVGGGVKVGSIDNLMAQSSFEGTTNATDLAINGNGFFEVKDSLSNAYYTRAGDFSVQHVDATHSYLETPDGKQLCDSTGAVINIASFDPITAGGTFSAITAIGTDGKITWQDNTGATGTATTGGGATTVQVGLTTFSNPSGLTRVGDTLFVANGAAGGSGTASLGVPTAANQIESDNLELSNVDVSTELVNLITTQRAYTANSKTITAVDEMTQDALNMIR